MNRCHIVILNYNGCDLLKECLPSIAEAAVKSRYAAAVTVLDNLGPDRREESMRFVSEVAQKTLDQSNGRTALRWEDSPVGNQILCSYNSFARRADEEVLIFLNNDIRVQPDFVDPLMDVFETHEDAFFAAPKVMNVHTRSYEGGRAKLEFRQGLPWGACRYPGHEAKIDRPGLTMQTGFGAFRRDRFLELNGYDDLYLPGTVEDMDLCFRAYRRGWKGYYEPTSVVHHIGQATFKKEFGAERIEKMNRRNLHLFVRKNIHDASLLAEYRRWLPIRGLTDRLRGKSHFLEAVREAEIRWRERSAKKEEIQNAVLSEREVFALSKGL